MIWPELFVMRKCSSVLSITEDAYHAVLKKIFEQGISDPVPVLKFNKQSKEYEIKSYSGTYVNKLKKEFANKNKPLIYPVGRINICIEDPDLLVQIKGKTLDYFNGRFVINNGKSRQVLHN